MNLATVLHDVGKTALNGAMLFTALVTVLATGPHIELALAPPVRLLEINDARVEAGEIRFSVLIAQKRRCIPSVRWETNGQRVYPSGPPLALTPGEAAEIGPFAAAIPEDGAGDLLTRITWILFSIFLVISLVLTILTGRMGGGSAADRLNIDGLDTRTLNAPVAPIAPAGQAPSSAQPGAIQAPTPSLNAPLVSEPAPSAPVTPAPAPAQTPAQ